MDARGYFITGRLYVLASKSEHHLSVSLLFKSPLVFHHRLLPSLLTLKMTDFRILAFSIQ